MLISVCLPVAEDVDESVNEAKLSAHEVSVGDFFIETFVMKFDNSVDGVAQHGLYLDHFGGSDVS